VDISQPSIYPDPLIGRRIGGCVIREPIGTGGMGRIYLAEQVALGRNVAVKVLRSRLRDQPVIAQRFLAEARAASRLNHPNSVAIIDFGVSEDGIAYLVMEHLDGEDLFTAIQKNGVPPLDEACGIAIAVLGVLAEAHALRIVHRDLKPENVLLVRRPNGTRTVKLLDFGVARIYSGQRTSGTTPLEGTFVGTPEYAAPEQMAGSRVDGRADLYALGMMLYEMTTGMVPFGEQDFAHLAARKLRDLPPDPRVLAPQRGIPDGLCAVIMRALSIRPDDRYRNAEAMIEALRAAAGGLGQTCTGCQALVGTSLRFCPHCGAPLGGRPVTPGTTPVAALDRAPTAPAVPSSSDTWAALDGNAWMTEIGAARAAAPHGLSVAVVAFDGRSASANAFLIRQVLGRFAAQGDAVHQSGPHPSRAPVPYAPIRTLLASLYACPEEDLRSVCAKLAPSLPPPPTTSVPKTPAPISLPSEDAGAAEAALARAGIEEVLSPRGLPGLDPLSRAPAVAWALAAACRTALARHPSRALVLAIRDAQHWDGSTHQAIEAFAQHHGDLHALLLASTDDEANVDLPGARRIQGSSGERARRATSGRWVAVLGGVPPGEGASVRELSSADAVAAAIDRLPAAARASLQAAAILGDRAPDAALGAVAGIPSPDVRDVLVASGLIARTPADPDLVFEDPFVRDVIVESMPAGARRELHDRALAYALSGGEPLEVCAEHASRGSDPTLAIDWLERVGRAAAARGDPGGAALAFRRALELARARWLASDDDAEERRAVQIARGLADALARTGDSSQAWGVVQEALDRTPPADPARAGTLITLGEVALARGRGVDAARAFGAATHLLAAAPDPDAEVRARVGLARAALGRGDVLAAIREAREATRVLAGLGARDERRPAVALFLAELLLATDDHDSATSVLQRAVTQARQAGAVALEAHALAAMAELPLSRNAGTADGDRRRAAALAAAAGDARSFVRWSRAPAE
jgi:serine/threonine-protein kinase